METFEQLRRSEAGAPDTVECRPIPEDSKERVDALRADTAFLSNFSNHPFSFEEIEIDKLVACQRTVHIDYVRHLQSEYERRGKDLFDFCLLQGQDVTQVNIGRTAPNAFTASSENPGLRFLGAYEQQYQREFLHGHAPGGQPVRTIILVLGYGSSTVNVYRVGTDSYLTMVSIACTR